MKTLILLLALAVPMNAEIRGAVRGGLFTGGNNDLTGTAELDLRHGNWALAPAAEGIRGGYGVHAFHVDVRRLFQTDRSTLWIGAGPTWVSTNSSSETTFNIDLGYQRRSKGRWEPFVAARYYHFDLPVFRDSVKDTGAVISVGVSARIY
jgi:hypothetical protein